MYSNPAPQLRQCLCGQFHSPYVLDPHARTVNGQLVRCHACDLENVAFCSHRSVGIDVVSRYIRRHGGSTFQVQTNIDEKTVYLRDRHGIAIARVSLRNRYPVRASVAQDIPY